MVITLVHRLRGRSALLASFIVAAAPLAAQGSLRDELSSLFTFGDCGAPLCLDVDPEFHGQHFIPANQAGNQAILSFLDAAIGRSVANLPLGATSSGVTFTFEGGVPVITSVSAGPIFAERAQTLGRGRVYVGVSMTGLGFEEIRGVSLDDLALNFAHEDVGDDGLGDPTFENDVFQVRLGLDMHVLITAVQITWGALDFADIGVVVPLVRTTLTGTSNAQIFPFGSTAFHSFSGGPGDPVLQDRTSASGSATGLGDIATRLKVNVTRAEHVGVAVLADLRLPTGSEEDFLGSGDVSWRAVGILSGRWSGFAPHLNTGYLVRTGDLDNDAFLATVGFDQLIGSWATVVAEFISEWQVGDSKLTLPGPIMITSPFQRTVPSSEIPSRRDDALAASLGLKATTNRGITMVGNVIIPLGNGGVQSGPVWTAGIEYTF